jgi:hypothetical protein
LILSGTRWAFAEVFLFSTSNPLRAFRIANFVIKVSRTWELGERIGMRDYTGNPIYIYIYIYILYIYL